MKTRSWSAAIVVVALAAALARAGEPTVLAEQSSGLVPLDGETSVQIRGFTGRLEVWGGEAEGVRFDCNELDTKTEAPVRVSSQDTRMLFEPPPDAKPGKRKLVLAVPFKFGVRIDAEGSEILVTRVDGASEIVGTNLTVDASGVGGTVTVDLQGGSLRAMDATGNVVLRGKDWSAQIGPVAGRVGVYGGPGSADIKDVSGRIDADVQNAQLHLVRVAGEMSVRVKVGSLEVQEAGSGGDLRLARAPLLIGRSEGRFDVATDAPVRFTELKADLRVDGDGASVEGTGNTQSVEVRTHDAPVTLNKIDGPVRIEGATLVVQAKVVGGDVHVDATASSIDLTSIAGKLDLKNEGGDIHLASVYGEASVNSRGGSVRVTDQGAPLHLRADGADASVTWSVFQPSSHSSIENDGGTVTIKLPDSMGGCRFDARSTQGRVEARYRLVVSASDATSAQGIIGADGAGSELRVEAAGDIRVYGGPPDTGGAR